MHITPKFIQFECIYYKHMLNKLLETECPTNSPIPLDLIEYILNL